MKKDDYRTEFEESRQKIDLNEEKVITRAELHSKVRKPKNTSTHKLASILFFIFTLIPIFIFAIVIFNWFFPQKDLTPKAEDSKIYFETSKNTSDKSVVLDDDDDEKIKGGKGGEEEQAEKAKKEEAEQAKKEKAEQAKKEEAEQAKKEQAEQAKKEEAERVKKEQAEQAKKEEAERVKKEQAEQAKKEEAERVKKEQAEQAKKEEEKSPARTHTVAASETLYRISVNYYGSGDGVSKIMQANGLTSNDISVGQKLIIP